MQEVRRGDARAKGSRGWRFVSAGHCRAHGCGIRETVGTPGATGATQVPVGSTKAQPTGRRFNNAVR